DTTMPVRRRSPARTTRLRSAPAAASAPAGPTNSRPNNSGSSSASVDPGSDPGDAACAGRRPPMGAMAGASGSAREGKGGGSAVAGPRSHLTAELLALPPRSRPRRAPPLATRHTSALLRSLAHVGEHPLRHRGRLDGTDADVAERQPAARMDREADERGLLRRRGEAARRVAVHEPRHPLAVQEHRVLLPFDADLELVPQARQPRREQLTLLLRLAVYRASAPQDEDVEVAVRVDAALYAQVQRQVGQVLLAGACQIWELQVNIGEDLH